MASTRCMWARALFVPVVQKGGLDLDGDSHCLQGNGEVNLTALEKCSYQENRKSDPIVRKIVHILKCRRVETSRTGPSWEFDENFKKQMKNSRSRTVEFPGERKWCRGPGRSLALTFHRRPNFGAFFPLRWWYIRQGCVHCHVFPSSIFREEHNLHQWGVSKNTGQPFFAGCPDQRCQPSFENCGGVSSPRIFCCALAIRVATRVRLFGTPARPGGPVPIPRRANR